MSSRENDATSARLLLMIMTELGGSTIMPENASPRILKRNALERWENEGGRNYVDQWADARTMGLPADEHRAGQPSESVSKGKAGALEIVADA